jgi:hypothetical protein
MLNGFKVIGRQGNSFIALIRLLFHISIQKRVLMYSFLKRKFFRVVASAMLMCTVLGFNGSFLPAAGAVDLDTLTIKTAGGQVFSFGEDRFTKLPRSTIKTHTPWTNGLQEFTGVALKDLLQAANISEIDAKNAILVARALNDYEVSLPARDAYDYNVLIADKMNGQSMPISQYGPFWIIYPRDDVAVLQDSRFDHRWAWQLIELRVQ